jgi:transposase
MTESNASGVVSIGVDTALVADHQIAIRGAGIREDFRVAPTLVGLAKLTERLKPFAGSLVVAEPTGGSWIPLSHAVAAAGCDIGFVHTRDSARLREAVAGRNKTDVIDAELLAQCEKVLGVGAAPRLAPGLIGLRRALSRRHKLTVEAHRAECRLWSLAIWAFPDVWRACGGHGVAQPVLGRWPELAGLARARLCSITELVAANSRDRDPARRAERIRDAARGWLRFWRDRLDLDTLAWEVAELLDDIEIADASHNTATAKAVELWLSHFADDVLTTVPGVGEICASATRAWWGEGRQLPTAKAAASFVGLNPSNWESGLTASPSRPITKEGPPALRLAYYQAANVARRHDPGLAAHYRKLMVERRHNHISANCAVARKLACRTWAVLQSGEPYQLRDLEGNVVDWTTATNIAVSLAVPEDVRRRARASTLKRGRLSA